ncbi:MAG: hypothetical protein ACE5Z5_05745 [Candidatus Bathyarchaeia archaeon]
MPKMFFYVEQVDPYIHVDIAAAEDPFRLSLGLRIRNVHTATLYFRVTGSGVDWIFGVQALGAVGAGASRHFIAPDLGSTPLPTSAQDKDILLTVEAYSDAYVTKVSEVNLPVTVRFIDSTDGSWTIDDEDTFDVDLDGWAAQLGTLSRETAYFLSPDYSAFIQNTRSSSSGSVNAEMVKTGSIGAGNEAFIILNLRLYMYLFSISGAMYVDGWIDGIEVLVGGTTYAIIRDTMMHNRITYLGYGHGETFVGDFWYHLVVPITPGAGNTVKVRIIGHASLSDGVNPDRCTVGAYVDNVKWSHR